MKPYKKSNIPKKVVAMYNRMIRLQHSDIPEEVKNDLATAEMAWTNIVAYYECRRQDKAGEIQD